MGEIFSNYVDLSMGVLCPRAFRHTHSKIEKKNQEGYYINLESILEKDRYQYLFCIITIFGVSLFSLRDIARRMEVSMYRSRLRVISGATGKEIITLANQTNVGDWACNFTKSDRKKF